MLHDPFGKSIRPKAVGSHEDRKELIAAAKLYVGKVLPGGHEIFASGVDHREKGTLSWDQLSEDALTAMVSALRAGKRGELPEFLDPIQAAKALGGKNLSELMHGEHNTRDR